MLNALRETGGGAVAVSDEELAEAARWFSTMEGLDLSPEGGATFAALRRLLAAGQVLPHERVVLFNTGAGWLYRST